MIPQADRQQVLDAANANLSGGDAITMDQFVAMDQAIIDYVESRIEKGR